MADNNYYDTFIAVATETTLTGRHCIHLMRS